jgi:hypothetical protein
MLEDPTSNDHSRRMWQERKRGEEAKRPILKGSALGLRVLA